MKIKKKGNKFVAYRDKNDVNSTDGCGMNSRIEVGDELGSISIKTRKFVGNTTCLVVLSKHLNEFLKPQEEKEQQLIVEVIEQVVADANSGDTTVLNEILRSVPIETLIQSLPEESWAKYK